MSLGGCPVPRWVAPFAIVGVLAAAALFQIAGCAPDRPNAATGNNAGATVSPARIDAVAGYEILDEEIADETGKASIGTTILVAPNVTRAELDRVLREVNAKNLARGGFTHHPRTTLSTVWAIPSREHPRHQWVGMIMQRANEAEPTVTILDRPPQAPGDAPQLKYGKTEAERRAIFREIFLASVAARKKADIDVPLPAAPTLEQAQRNSDAADAERARLNDGLAKKYGLTSTQLEDIATEAMTAEWPEPEYEP